MKFEIQKAIRRVGFDVRRLNPSQLGVGQDLTLDLPLLVNRENPVVIDVGANKGQRIDLVRRAFHTPLITCFEPNPNLCDVLRSSYSEVATIVEAAVGSSSGEMQFHIYANDRLSSLRDLADSNSHFVAEETRLESTIQVPVVTLDDYWHESGEGGRIDLLLIDAQGFDREVLRGAKGLMSRGLIGTIIMDLYCAAYYGNQDNFFWDVHSWLAREGYGLVGLYEIVRRGSVIHAAAGCFQPLKTQSRDRLAVPAGSH